MLSRLSSFFQKHKRKIFIFGGVLGGLAILNAYLKRKFVDWESKRALEYLEKIEKLNHFKGAMSTCDSAIISLAPKVREIVSGTVDINPIVRELKENPSNKLQLWNRLKVLVFTQALGEMYAQCLLAVLLRVQISILSGYAYSSIRGNLIQNGTNFAEKNQKYMSCITDFLISGVKELLDPIKATVSKVLEGVPLDSLLKISDIEHKLHEIKVALPHGSNNSFPDVSLYLASFNVAKKGDNNGNLHDEFFANIISETKDILECEDFNRVLTDSIERGMSTIMDRITECYAYLSDNNENFVNIHEFSAPLAKIIPMMHNTFSQHLPDEQDSLIHVLLQQDSIRNFSANLYEAFSNHST